MGVGKERKKNQKRPLASKALWAESLYVPTRLVRGRRCARLLRGYKSTRLLGRSPFNNYLTLCGITHTPCRTPVDEVTFFSFFFVHLSFFFYIILFFLFFFMLSPPFYVRPRYYCNRALFTTFPYTPARWNRITSVLFYCRARYRCEILFRSSIECHSVLKKKEKTPPESFIYKI